jgi:PST family polysaccharide transporter
MVRNKLLAVLLGPMGVGLAGLYTSVTSLVSSVTGLGIPTSGVRQIADSINKNDHQRIAVTVATLRAITWLAGLVGMCSIVLFASPISQKTFLDHNHVWGLIIVAAVVLIDGIAAKHRTVLQGLRRVAELSACQVLGAIGGTIAAIPLLFIFHDRGIPGFLVAASLCGALAAWWFARRQPVQKIHLSRQQFFSELRGLMNVGTASVAVGMLATGVMYLARLMVVRILGMDAVGLYQATWTLSSTYVGVVLTAMGTDFFPRISAAIGDRTACNRLINEQTEMGILIALPGVLATVVLAPWVLQGVYSAAFRSATDVIRWQILGVALRVVSWPLGVIPLAKGRGGLFILIETCFAIIQLALLYLCVQWRQFEGIGIAVFLHSAVYLFGILVIAGLLTRFSWTRHCQMTLLVAALATGAAFLLCRYTRPAISVPSGLLITALAAVWSLKKLQTVLGKDFLPGIYRSLIEKLRRVFAQNSGD